MTVLELVALAEKYRALIALRARRDAGREPDPAVREVLRALAARFPGSLRELDTLGRAELERRAEATSRAASGGPEEPWMAWIMAYHRLMAAVLAIKRETAAGRRARIALSDVQAAALAANAARETGFPLDSAFVRCVDRPARGRLGPLVMATLSHVLGIKVHLLSKTLFPPRRPSSPRPEG
jgi:hypothetical protein